MILLCAFHSFSPAPTFGRLYSDDVQCCAAAWLVRFHILPLAVRQNPLGAWGDSPKHWAAAGGRWIAKVAEHFEDITPQDVIGYPSDSRLGILPSGPLSFCAGRVLHLLHLTERRIPWKRASSGFGRSPSAF